MTSYEDRFKQFESMIDHDPKATKGKSGPKERSTSNPVSIPTNPASNTYIRTVGFGASSATETQENVGQPLSIPSRGGRTSTRVSPTASSSPEKKIATSLQDQQFKSYKSQLSGWSNDGSSNSLEGSTGTSPKTRHMMKPLSPSSAPSPIPLGTSPPLSPRDRKRTGSTSVPMSNVAAQHLEVQNQQQMNKPHPLISEADKAKLSKEERRALYIQQGFVKQGGPAVPKGKQGKQQQQQAPQKGSNTLQVNNNSHSNTASPIITGANKQNNKQSKQQQGTPQMDKSPSIKDGQATPGSATPDASKLSTTPPSASAVVRPTHKPAVMQFDDEKRRTRAEKKKVLQLQPTQKRVALFAHLPQYESLSSLKLNVGFSVGQLHPTWLELGLKYAKGSITGSSARCVAMLLAFKKVIQDFNSPSGLLFRDFDIKTMIQFLVDCRPLSISMGNAINYLKSVISETKKFSSLEQGKEFVCESIDKYIQERIQVADEIVASNGASRINDGDVVLTYAKSFVVEMILKKAHDEGKKFRVIVVDSKPRKEGKVLLKNLVHYGIECTYIYLNAISYIMKEVSKVLVGAYAMMANGNLISRVGTALVGVMAKSYHVPFIVCCETFKFTERVQLESISFNELADPDELLQIDSEEDPQLLKEWKDIPALKLLNLVYDLTPSEFIMAVITEVGMIPPTSVPVVLRVLYTMES